MYLEHGGSNILRIIDMYWTNCKASHLVSTEHRKKQQFFSVYIVIYFVDLVANVVSDSVSVGLKCEVTIFPSDALWEPNMTSRSAQLN